MTDYGTTDTSTTVLAANQFPVGAVFVPGDSKLTAAQGRPKGTDSNGKTYAPAAIYLPDGNDATQGTSTDAAWSGSGAATSIALLKKLVAELAGTLSVSGAITANAGTNLNTSPLALESGGNLASLKTDADAINTAIGAQADATWSGSGSGSEIAILKKVVALLSHTHRERDSHESAEQRAERLRHWRGNAEHDHVRCRSASLWRRGRGRHDKQPDAH